MREDAGRPGGGARGEEGPGLAGELRSWGALAPALAPSWRAGVQQKGRGKEAQAWRENSAPGENYAPASAPASTSRFRTDLRKKKADFPPRGSGGRKWGFFGLALCRPFWSWGRGATPRWADGSGMGRNSSWAVPHPPANRGTAPTCPP